MTFGPTWDSGVRAIDAGRRAFEGGLDKPKAGLYLGFAMSLALAHGATALALATGDHAAGGLTGSLP